VTITEEATEVVVSSVLVGGGSGSLIALGLPTDGDLDDGQVPLTPTTSITDAIDAINEATKAIVTDDLTLGGNLTVGKEGSPKQIIAHQGIGEYGETPPSAQPPGIIVPSDLSTAISAIVDIINVLENKGTITKIVSQISTDFDGSNDFVDLGNDTSLQITNNLTVSVWMKGPVASLGMMATKWQPTGNQRSWAAATVTGGLLNIFLSADGSSVGKNYKSSLVVSDNTWHHVVFTFATNVLKIYVDGAEDTSVTKTTDLTVNSIHNANQAVLLGRQAAGNSYLGRVDEFSVWNAELSSAEIAEIYNSGTPGDLQLHSKQANLVSWLQMGDGAIYPTIPDVKGSNDGTMTNMAADDFVVDSPP
jgi:hypothetical protein